MLTITYLGQANQEPKIYYLKKGVDEIYAELKTLCRR